MKKVITGIIIFVLICPLVNLPVYIYSNIYFYDSDTLMKDFQDNLDYYYDGKCTEAYLKYYEENIEDLLKAVLKIDFIPVQNIDTIITLAFRDIDKESRMSSMPMNNNSDIDIKLGNIQFFALDGKNYMLCHYRIDTFYYKLYTYEDNQELNSVLNKECFLTDGLFNSAKKITVRAPAYTLLYGYAPAIVLTLLLFFPFLLFINKRISAKNKKRITFAANVGLVAVPVCAIVCSTYIYRYSVSPELLPSFFFVMKEIITRLIG